MALQDREIIFKISLHLIADGDTAENNFGIVLCAADADTAVLCNLEGTA